MNINMINVGFGDLFFIKEDDNIMVIDFGSNGF